MLKNASCMANVKWKMEKPQCLSHLPFAISHQGALVSATCLAFGERHHSNVGDALEPERDGWTHTGRMPRA
jgi:hypothetical protein